MPIQLTHTDLNSTPQKLSKIETLRIARNYIIAMTQTLQENNPMEITRFIKILSRELSQTTANLLSGTLLKRSLNHPYRTFYSNDYDMSTNENNCQNYNALKPQYMMYGENYGSLWDYRKGNVSYDNHNTSTGKNFNNFSKYWEYNNVIGNHYPYGSYQYITWQ